MCGRITSLIKRTYKVHAANLTAYKQYRTKILTTCPVRNAQISDVTDVKQYEILFEFQSIKNFHRTIFND